ncbi:MAG: hypothetical protein AAFY46_11570 [Planctomycetota bacterium]
MRLSELMSNMDLAVWPKMALVIFLVVFAAVVIRAMTSKRTYTDRMSAMPLADDATPTKTRNTDKGTRRGA